MERPSDIYFMADESHIPFDTGRHVSGLISTFVALFFNAWAYGTRENEVSSDIGQLSFKFLMKSLLFKIT